MNLKNIVKYNVIFNLYFNIMFSFNRLFMFYSNTEI